MGLPLQNVPQAFPVFLRTLRDGSRLSYTKQLSQAYRNERSALRVKPGGHSLNAALAAAAHGSLLPDEQLTVDGPLIEAADSLQTQTSGISYLPLSAFEGAS